MLEALRNAANSWVLKPLLVLLVLAFIVWGVADVFTGFRGNTLASVGSAEISADEYQRTYGLVMDNFARRFGRRPTAEEARLRGLDRAVLEDMVNSATLDQHAAQLNMALSQKSVVAQIEKDPTFQGVDGRFNRLAFDAFLRETGFNERGWLSQKRREELRQQLSQPMFQQMPVPKALIDLVHNYREETRTVQVFTIEPDKVVKIAEPDEAKLKETYSAQQRQFVTPEFRQLAVLLLSGDEIKAKLAITDEELRKAYDGDKVAQNVAERRRVQQIPFKDKAAAEAAAKAIAGGKSFLDAAKEAGAAESDIELGMVTKAELLDPRIAEAAFALGKDRVSAPVEGRFTTVLLRVTEIEAGKTRSFEEMKQEIRDKIAASRLNEEIRKRHDAIDDGRSAGKPLKEIAATVGAKFVEVPATDRRGRKPDGTPAWEGPDMALVLQAGFEGKVGVEGETFDLADGGYGWVDVMGITPERQRPYEEVVEDVKAVYKDLETARQVGDLAGKMIERAGKGETLSSMAKEAGGKLETSRPFKRFGEDGGLPPAAVQRAFALPLGGLASTETGEGKKRIVFRLVEIKKPDPATKEQSERIEQQLRSERQQDAVQAYVTALRERLGVSINEALFRRTTGVSADGR